MSVLFGPTNAASVALLNRAGYDVAVPARQGCCGALHAHGGNLEAARDCARRNLAAFEGVALDAVVVNAAGCGSTLKEYGELLQHDAVWADRAKRFARQVRDLSEILVQAPGFTGPRRAASRIHGLVTVQDACHLAHAQRVTRAPRDLVRAIAGDSLVEMPESDICCGSAGSYNLTEPGMAARLQSRKVENILRSGATLVVTTNPGCLLQMRAGLRKAGANHVQVLHLADYLLTTGESFDEAETRLAVRRPSG
jgi:glycolate oxidase iron-sulfur subunit